jgi:hypothetical protein
MWAGIGAESTERVSLYPMVQPDDPVQDASVERAYIVGGTITYTDIFDMRWESDFLFFCHKNLVGTDGQNAKQELGRAVSFLRAYAKEADS